MTMRFSVCFCVILSTIPTNILGETADDVKALLTDVYTTRGYNQKIRPLIDQKKALTINVDFYLNSVIDFDEKTESLKTAGYLFLSWTDEYFTWAPASFNDTDHVFVPQDDIWKPDISLKNSFKSFSGLGYQHLYIEVDQSGHARWFPFQVFESTCSVSITYFPFDVQTCELKFSAWSYSKVEVELILGKKGMELEEYVPNASWEVVETSAEGITLEAAVIFRIKLKRKPRFYIINIVIPIIFLSVLNVFSFVLPVMSGERAGYSITVFLSLAVFLTIISDQLPNNSDNTSLMAVYIMLITGLSTSIVMLCMIQLRLQSWNDTPRPVTKFYRNFVSIRNFFRCQKRRKQSVVPEHEMSSAPDLKNNEMEQPTVTWHDVINSMDFIFFTAALLYTLVCTVVVGAVAVNFGE